MGFQERESGGICLGTGRALLTTVILSVYCAIEPPPPVYTMMISLDLRDAGEYYIYLFTRSNFYA